MTNSLPAAIGRQIARRRTERGMTAAELARRAGISKGTLSALEAGTGNPTIATLDALAVTLRIPLTDLLARETDHGPVFVAATGDDPTDIKRELLRRISSGHSLEIWRMRIPPDHTSRGVEHAPGTIEHLYVSAGRLTAGPEGAPCALGVGDMLAFAGDAPHVYVTGDQPADITVIFAAPLT